MNDPPMAFGSVQYIWNKISWHLWNSEQLTNLTREESKINMGNNEQLCVNKKNWGFDVHGDNYCVVKMFVERQCVSKEK
jgi:hypothetical protein